MPKQRYRPRIFQDRVMTATEQRQLYNELVKLKRFDVVSDEMRRLIEEVWPELVHKLPSREPNS
jgi:hypothetical protein